MVKNLPAKQEMWVLYLGQKDTLVKGMATYSRILAKESHGQRNLASAVHGVARVGHDRATTLPRLCITNAFKGDKGIKLGLPDSSGLHIWGGKWSVSVITFSSSSLPS